MLVKKRTQAKKKLGEFRAYNITYAAPAELEVSFLEQVNNGKMVGFYVKAAAANDQDVIIVNKNDSAAVHDLMPANLHLAAGSSAYIDLVENVKFAILSATITQVLYVMPVFET